MAHPTCNVTLCSIETVRAIGSSNEETRRHCEVTWKPGHHLTNDVPHDARLSLLWVLPPMRRALQENSELEEWPSLRGEMNGWMDSWMVFIDTNSTERIRRTLQRGTRTLKALMEKCLYAHKVIPIQTTGSCWQAINFSCDYCGIAALQSYCYSSPPIPVNSALLSKSYSSLDLVDRVFRYSLAILPTVRSVWTLEEYTDGDDPFNSWSLSYLVFFLCSACDAVCPSFLDGWMDGWNIHCNKYD